jgi:hypothetical protein
MHERLLAKYLLASSDGIHAILLMERVRAPMYMSTLDPNRLLRSSRLW